ncbi:MAG: PfkB family carbohydrate kinase [Candidatus Aminicenantes bacterium]|nr:PfkB family carbohydrate kinase [Candidatus Aminicenantes bacterium]MDH5466014.1 PfkB family carbohydrate kinase [Candidatus Aminicenantes bacterium]
MSLVIVGSVAFDTIETPFDRRERIVGGSGTYCSLAASFFTQPKLVAAVGEDFPEEMVEFFNQRRIDTRGVEIKQGKSFFWEARYGDDPNQRTTLKTEPNVFENFRPQLPSDYRQNGIVFLANIDPDLQDDILSQVTKPQLVAMDTINFWINRKPASLLRVLEKVDLYFANDEEIRLLTREKNLIKAGKKILEGGPSLVAIKKGEHGALVMGKDFVFGVLAHPCEEVVDPTGAGDSFAGGFLGYLDKAGNIRDENEFRKATVYGSVMASFVIEDFGINRLKSLSIKEIEERFSYFKKLVSF